MFTALEREQMIQAMRDELTCAGVKELRTAEEVEEALGQAKGIALVFVNSVCGCAAGKARPGLVMSLKNEVLPDHLFTVFAGQDKEATEAARKFFTNQPPSSPSIAYVSNAHVMLLTGFEQSRWQFALECRLNIGKRPFPGSSGCIFKHCGFLNGHRGFGCRRIDFGCSCHVQASS